MQTKPCPIDRGKLLISIECCRAARCLECPYSDTGCQEQMDDALAYIYYLEEQLNAKAGGSE